MDAVSDKPYYIRMGPERNESYYMKIRKQGGNLRVIIQEYKEMVQGPVIGRH